VKRILIADDKGAASPFGADPWLVSHRCRRWASRRVAGAPVPSRPRRCGSGDADHGWIDRRPADLPRHARTSILMYTMHWTPPLELAAQKSGIRKLIPKSQSTALLKTIEELLGQKGVAPSALVPESLTPLEVPRASAEPAILPTGSDSNPKQPRQHRKTSEAITLHSQPESQEEKWAEAVGVRELTKSFPRGKSHESNQVPERSGPEHVAPDASSGGREHVL
jgi:hypothetical protein